ncbi:MAG TPA: CapA family protein [Gemmatimonadaceae bacterium]|nr:CapA family protein [Gemmatimonadaceae bacterium]
MLRVHTGGSDSTRVSDGRIYLWIPDARATLGGKLGLDVVSLPRLFSAGTPEARLCGTFVEVHNAGALNSRQVDGSIAALTLGDAQASPEGAFLFGPSRGGGRVDKCAVPPTKRRARYIEAARFGEVNTYYHVDRIASHLDALIRELGRSSLPRVIAKVNAHHAATEADGVRDGRWLQDRWHPFQGGHYRLPSRKYDIAERGSISVDGEIHLGPGRKLLHHGALVEASGTRYRANASHNPGIIYHEYAHHLTRHTADFRANAVRDPLKQDNRKTAMDEGTCDYWTAVMLDTPHIWACHRRHDDNERHSRSLSSRMTMDDFDDGPGADPHFNGTIWGAALWDFRSHLRDTVPDGARRADLIVVHALILIGGLGATGRSSRAREVRQARKSFGAGLAALRRAADDLFSGAHTDTLLGVFAARGINPETIDWSAPSRTLAAHPTSDDDAIARSALDGGFERLVRRVSADDIPGSDDILSTDALRQLLAGDDDPRLSFLGGGDVMLGGRGRKAVEELGIDYPLAAVQPLLALSPIVMANLEGPFAAGARRVERQFSYRVNPGLASALPRAGVNVVTLANNHLVDCDRDGVTETLETLRRVGVSAVGAGADQSAAHAPAIIDAYGRRVGILAYYWNRRCAATSSLPGSAMDPPEALEEDIRTLRARADRIVVTFHWGIPYDRNPSAEDRAKARFAIDCGADVVIGHHPHVLQPFEIHRGRPIFYSVGNLAFGSGNSHAEGCLIGIRFDNHATTATIYPLYVKNRDPRVNYQPKLLRGMSARRILLRLAQSSGSAGELLRISDYHGSLVLPRSSTSEAPVRTGTNG